MEDKIDCYILIHNFFSGPYHVVLFSRPHLALFLLLDQGYSTGDLWATAPTGTLSDCKLSLGYTASNYLNWLGPSHSICRYHFITILHKPHDCFYLFTQVRLWLMARTRVHMQHLGKVQTPFPPPLFIK